MVKIRVAWGNEVPDNVQRLLITTTPTAACLLLRL